MLLWVLVGLLVGLLVFELIHFKKNVLEPSVIFTFAFVLLSVMALIFSDEWNLDLHLNTFLVVGGGVFEFFLVCLITKKVINFFRRKKHGKKETDEDSCATVLDDREVKIASWKKVLCLIGIIISGIIYLSYIIKATGVEINGLFDIPKAISSFDTMTKFSESNFNVDLPFLVTNLHVIIIGLGYWFACLIAHNLACMKKVKVLDVLNLFACFVVSMLGGSRGHVIFIVIVGIAYFLVLIAKKKNFKNYISAKFAKRVLIIGAVLLCVFIPMARLLGRNVKESPIEYMSIYCGAQMKNLDVYLQKHDPNDTSELFGEQTFMSLYRTVGKRLGIERFIYKSDIPFRIVNGHNLGNVYTTFYAYIHDFGYTGVVVMVFIMAVISQFVFELVKVVAVKKRLNILIMCYGLIVNALFLSFFGEKFFAGINMATLRYIIVWVVCNFVFVSGINIKSKLKKGV